MKRAILVTCFALVIIALGASNAFAVTSYLNSFNTTYGTTNTKLNDCALCHIQIASPRNTYGIDYMNNGHSFNVIENLDSDGDGATNIAEISAGTFPGDASDKPAPAPAPTPTQDPTPAPAPAPDPVPAPPAPDPAPAPAPTPDPAPAPDPVPAPVQDPVPAPDPTPVVEPTPVPLLIDPIPSVPVLDPPTIPAPTVPEKFVDIQVTFGNYMAFDNHVLGYFIVQNNGTDEETVPVAISDGQDWARNRVRALAPGESKVVRFWYRIAGEGSFTITATANVDGDIAPDNNIATATISLNTSSFWRFERDDD